MTDDRGEHGEADGLSPSPASSSAGRALASPGRLLTGFAVAALAGGVVGGLVVSATSDNNGTGRVSTSGAGSPAVCQASAVAETGLPSVVTIAARSSESSGTGSGVIFEDGGYILTNDHVISVAANGGHVTVLFSDGASVSATIVGRDPLTDLAVIKASGGAEGLPVISLGSSADLVVGQPVVALGAPLGLSSTVTAGIVSALDRHVPVPVNAGQTAHLVGAIQTDASINPGNSGGALVDCAARLVGVNTAIATVRNSAGHGGGGSVGLGFAIPVALAKPIADEIIATGTITHFTVGLQVQAIPSAAAEAAGLPEGLFVDSVTLGGPAEQAGIARGDVITAINGDRAVSAEQLIVAEITVKSGQPIEVTYDSGGQSTTATLTPVPQS